MTTPKQPPTTWTGTSSEGSYIETLGDPLGGKGVVTSSPAKVRKNPVTGKLAQHSGTDIGIASGTPVQAAAGGIANKHYDANGYGNYVTIDHDDGTHETLYGHLSEVDIQDGQRVVKGEVIGKVGSTGRSTGSHLHYEIRENGKPVLVNARTGAATTITANSNNRSPDARKAADAASANGGNAADPYSEPNTVLNYNQDDVIRGLITGDHFTENPANDLYNFTYHWRFFATSDSEIVGGNAVNADSSVQKFYENLAKNEQVTIAESGVTGFNIESVTMDGNIGTDFQSSSSTFTNFEMKITEPNGVKFLDALRNAALQLKIQNYQKSFYYLELTFKGYDEDGTPNLAPFKDFPNGGKWLWSVCITDIQVALSAGGGTYVLKMVPMEDTLQIAQYNLLPGPIPANGSTVGEVFDNLALKLNQQWEAYMGRKDIITYEFKFHPVKDVFSSAEEVRKMSVVFDKPELNEERSKDFKADENKGERTSWFPKGSTISQTLDTVMQSCVPAQKLALDVVKENVVDEGNNRVNAKGFRQSILWRIEPEVHFTGFDPLSNDYQKKFTIHIYGFRNHAAVLSPIESKSSIEIQKAILADLAHRNFLPKKYEYLFSGVNSEVLDLDLNYNLAWCVQLPRFVESTQEQTETHAKAPTESEKNAASNANQPSTANPKLTPSQILGNNQQISTEYNSKKDELQRLLAQRENNPESVSDADLRKLTEEVKVLKAKNTESSLAVQKADAEARASRPLVMPATNYEREYAEDLTNQKSDITDETQYLSTMPISTTNVDMSDVTGMTGQNSAGKSLYGAVLNQVYGTVASQFLTIELTVRGDPFWIGAGSFEKLTLRKSEVFDSHYPNTQEGCNNFLLRFFYPLGQNDDGELELRTNEVVNGIYQVNKVSHRFQEGKFTQVLSAYRVVNIDLYRALYNNNAGNNGATGS